MNNWPRPSIPIIWTREGVTINEWTDWQWQLSHAIRKGEQLKKYAGLSDEQVQSVNQIIQHEYLHGRDEMLITPHLLSLMNLENPNDPIALQHFPNRGEQTEDTFKFENVWEKDEDFLDGNNRMLQQKYPDILVIRLANTCQSFCRFCFEKERTLRRAVPTRSNPEQFNHALEIIRSKPDLRQVLISGGDPSIIPDAILYERIKSILEIPHIKTIRIGTRMLLHNPYRVTMEYAELLGSLQKEFQKNTDQVSKKIEIGAHFNHPKELSPEALAAIRRLHKEGVKLYNQTVLLKGINDNTETLTKLFRILLNENVSLHYLFHAMPVPRTNHFRTSVRKGQELMKELRRMKEFRAQLPRYVIPHETGKQLAEFMTDEFFETTINRGGTSQKVIRFKSDITRNWEEYPDGE